MMISERWKKPGMKYRNRIDLGIPPKYAYMAGNTRKGTARAATLTTAKRSHSNQKLETLGYYSIYRCFELMDHPAVQSGFAL